MLRIHLKCRKKSDPVQPCGHLPQQVITLGLWWPQLQLLHWGFYWQPTLEHGLWQNQRTLPVRTGLLILWPCLIAFVLIITFKAIDHMNSLLLKRHNSNALAMQLCMKPSIFKSPFTFIICLVYTILVAIKSDYLGFIALVALFVSKFPISCFCQ